MAKNNDDDQRPAKPPAKRSRKTDSSLQSSQPNDPVSQEQLEEFRDKLVHGIAEVMANATVEQTVLRQFMGPLPPPEVLEDYNNALPDGAERIVMSFEKQGNHRRRTETRSQIFAFVIALAAIVGAVICALNDRPFVGATIVVAGMIGIGLTGALKLFLRRRTDGR